VNGLTLAALDRLEGHPVWYYRHPVRIVLSNDGSGSSGGGSSEEIVVEAETYVSDSMSESKGLVPILDGDYRLHLIRKQTK